MAAWATLALSWLLLHAGSAQAVPSYARQTHLPCSSCHVGAFGPELTPFGRDFKLDGYTMSVGDDAKIPLSAMLVESFVHTGQPQDPADLGKPYHANDNASLDQASLFLAGRISAHMGVFAQATYSEVGGRLGWDNIDVRYARRFKIGKHSSVWGVTLNNNPTISDVFASAPAWMFPYMGSDLAPGAPAQPMIYGGLGGQVVGVTGYTQLDGKLYLEAGGYRSLSSAWTRLVNADYDGRLSGVAPYARGTYTWSTHDGGFTLGAFLLDARRGGVGSNAKGDAIALPGPTDNFRDAGLSGDYEYFAGDHTVTANALYVHERQTLNNTFADGGSSHLKDTLDALNVKGSYWYRNTYGVSLAQFNYTGSRDLLLYGNDGSSDTRGGTLELDYNPFGKSDSWKQPYMNMRVGLQYTWYSRFSGRVHNVDGAGRNASGNDTTYLYVWFAL